MCTYGDLMRVPGSHGAQLLKAKAAGADIRMVYSTIDALRIAEAEPERQVVFFAIGFETTTPPTALAIKPRREKTRQLHHFLQPRAHPVGDPEHPRKPGRADLTGTHRRLHRPGPCQYGDRQPALCFFCGGIREACCDRGFEPLDVMQAILMLVRQVNEGRHEVENQYTRAVKPEGNEKAKAEVAEIFELRKSFEWRGLGLVPYSGLRLKEAYAAFDAERRFAMEDIPAEDNPACECGAILRGVKQPADCKLFGTVCTPETPMGSCMVSAEGACAAHWTYGRFRDRAREAS